MTDAQQIRLIKKYPNRRLYDTASSAYITIGDVKNLVLSHEPFRIVDAKTGEDLTRSVLLQIILEEEACGQPLFSSEMLAQIIRFYGQASQNLMGRYLENSIAAFVEMQNKFQEQLRSLYGDKAPLGTDWMAQFLSLQAPALQSMMNAYLEQSRQLLTQMQQQAESQTRGLFGAMFSGLRPQTDESASSGTTSPTKPDET
ncbi:polyhydroxyalkanoate synthesis repressor PhaR [Tepidiphilus baoligensis]|uniref:Polyhydroxyalkanoate synthesis repressor PhaR n=1 Tax=Tepidiphilus baoligensis TaxID=2698687 RepID=A0ABX1QKY0_9PROT|nr:polyhydroxyalkanoate synthesis repressor PhaR [Tepidiphilus baoligensis]NMH16347.1 polyhydroxyalkanoate synthesis repressor PhaR [Tepidiphilus baoligensis]